MGRLQSEYGKLGESGEALHELVQQGVTPDELVQLRTAGMTRPWSQH